MKLDATDMDIYHGLDDWTFVPNFGMSGELEMFSGLQTRAPTNSIDYHMMVTESAQPHREGKCTLSRGRHHLHPPESELIPSTSLELIQLAGQEK